MAKTIQNEFKPDYASPPGDTLQEMMEWYKVTPTQLAEECGRTVEFINQLLVGQAAITPELASHLERLFKMSADFWMRREQGYREALERIGEIKPLEEQIKWVDNFDVEELIAQDWIEDLREEPDEQLWELLFFFDVISPTEWRKIWDSGPVAAFRVSSPGQSDPYALAAWLRKGELDAQEIDCEPYDEKRFRAALQQIRALTTEAPEDFLAPLTELCAQAGVAVTFVPTLSNISVSGATRWLTPEMALIQLSLPQNRHTQDDQLWFSFFHEAGHILLHDKRDVFLEYEGKEEAADKEQQADEFAADLLIPAEAYELFVQQNEFSDATICTFAAQIGIAPGLVVGRLPTCRALAVRNTQYAIPLSTGTSVYPACLLLSVGSFFRHKKRLRLLLFCLR